MPRFFNKRRNRINQNSECPSYFFSYSLALDSWKVNNRRCSTTKEIKTRTPLFAVFLVPLRLITKIFHRTKNRHVRNTRDISLQSFQTGKSINPTEALDKSRLGQVVRSHNRFRRILMVLSVEPRGRRHQTAAVLTKRSSRSCPRRAAPSRMQVQTSVTPGHKCSAYISSSRYRGTFQ